MERMIFTKIEPLKKLMAHYEENNRVRSEANFIKVCQEKIAVKGKVSLDFNFTNKTPLYLPQPSSISSFLNSI